VYKMRKAIVEPVFGQIKEQRGFSPLQLAWQRECQLRVEAGVRGQQPAEAVQGRMGSRNGLKQQAKKPILPKAAEMARYKLPTGTTACTPYIRHPDLKTDESGLANAMTDRHLDQPQLILQPPPTLFAVVTTRVKLSCA